MMVESEAQELSEDVMLGAVMFGHKRNAARHQRHHPPGGEGGEGAARCRDDTNASSMRELKAVVWRRSGRGLPDSRKACARRPHQGNPSTKRRRNSSAKASSTTASSSGLMHDLEAHVMRNAVLDTKKRIDGRDLVTVRPIVAEVGVLPRTHGSALFTRGETQALVVDDARHRRGRTVRRQPGGHLQADTSCCITISRPTGRRNRPHGAPAGAKSAMASSPGAPSIRCCRRRKTSPTRMRVVSEITEIQRLLLDGDGVRHLAGADGCGRADHAPDRRHRHGPDPGRRALCGAVRHSGRRGSSGRHGLQGGGHRNGRHLPADGHQDRRHHRRDHARGARSGERRPPAYPGRDEQGDQPRPRRARRTCAAHRDNQDSRPTRSAK